MSDLPKYKADHDAATQTWEGNWSWDTRKASDFETLRVSEAAEKGLAAQGPPRFWDTERRNKGIQWLMLRDGFWRHKHSFTEKNAEWLVQSYMNCYFDPINFPSKFIRFDRKTGKYVCQLCYWSFDKDPFYPPVNLPPAKRAKH